MQRFNKVLLLAVCCFCCFATSAASTNFVLNGKTNTLWNGKAITAWNGKTNVFVGGGGGGGGGLSAANFTAYWKMNDASGNATDSIGSTTLTDNGTIGSTTGKVGNCRTFSAASSQYFSVNSNAAILTGDVDFTVVVAFYITDDTVNSPLICKDTVAYTEYYLRYNFATDNIIFYMKDLAGSISTANGTVLLNTWYLAVVWYDHNADTLNMQLNGGTPVAPVTVAGGNTTTTGPLWIGRGYSGLYATCRIDEVLIGKQVLDATQRDTLWTTFNAGNEPF